MTEEEMNKEIMAPIERLLDSLAPDKLFVFVATLRLFAECCHKDSETGLVLIVRRPSETHEWVLNVTSLNATRDDAYEMLDTAYNRIAADIITEAPKREHFN